MKAKIVRATKQVIRFLGPVANSVHGQLSRPEIARALVQAVANGGMTWATIRATITAPTTLTEVVVPLGAAVVTGVMDALGRLEHGEIKPKPEDSTPTLPLPPSQP